MFDLFLNAAKFATSEDVRKSTSAILEMIRRSPEWQNEICKLEAKIGRVFKEQAEILGGLTTSKLQALSYSKEVIGGFKTAYLELVENAFEHGCRKNKDSIKVEIDITRWIVTLTVMNPKGRKFDLEEELKRNRKLLKEDPSRTRGRGLILVYELSDTLTLMPDKDGVKAVFYDDRVSFEVNPVSNDITIIRMSGGLGNPSFKRRIIDISSQHFDKNLILDFRDYAIFGSDVFKGILNLNEIYSKTERKIVALVTNLMKLELLDSILAYSMEEAVRKIYSNSPEDKILSSTLSEAEIQVLRKRGIYKQI